jgi:hypothetical protein
MKLGRMMVDTTDCEERPGEMDIVSTLGIKRKVALLHDHISGRCCYISSGRMQSHSHLQGLRKGKQYKPMVAIYTYHSSCMRRHASGL